ncbi:hypothetical protein LY632_05880 [Erythrobacter sp. SDW2]|uniref:Rap1a/Tai family immunity protein n=1 Tax=Erythrobacter sp. SDW2 TaxID=2907154 RepID=UPI001F341F10|nr:Rap1a/Tai family immunity protein [Erythrobacter sp. SDW2]UIP07925.1 hypothetical protein LY632_05880 [Erythrobacter sp. SDW2]
MRIGRVFAGLAAVGLAMTPATVSAQDIAAQSIFKSGQQLLNECGSSDSNALARCDWYIMGIWDAFGLLADLEITERYMCLENGTTVDVLRSDVIRYLRNGSTDLNKSAVSAVANAIMEAHPC